MGGIHDAVTARRCALLALLTALAPGCSNTHSRLERQFEAARDDVRRGAVSQALALIDRGEAAAGDPASEWGWRFRLLRAEVFLLRRDGAGATEALSLLERPHAEAPLPALGARRTYLEAQARVLQGKLVDALELLTEARQQASGAPEDEVLLDIDILRGQVLLRTARWSDADALLQDVLGRARARRDPYHQAAALHNLARGRVVRNRFDEALAFLEHLLELDELEGYTVYASALTHAGISYSRLGQFDKAAAVQRRAIESHEKGGVPLYLEQALGELGNTYVLQNDPRRGMEYLSRAFDVATRANLIADAAIWAGNLAEAAGDLGDFDQAHRYNTEAIRLNMVSRGNQLYYILNAGKIAVGRGELAEAVKLYREALDASAADPAARWEAHTGLAKSALASGDTRRAAQHFDAALGTIQQARSGLHKAEHRVTFLSRVIRFYQDYVDTLVAIGETTRALEVADSSRGVVLAERMGGTAASQATSAASFVAAAARSRTVWLSYWLAPERSYVWVVSAAGVRSVTLPGAARIEHLVKAYRTMIVGSSADPLSLPDSPGDALYAAIVAPVVRFIPPGSSIRIVADGALHGINFETLPVDGPRRHYWIEDVTIAVAPSLGLLASNAERPRAAQSRSLLLVGDPTPRLREFPRLGYAPIEMQAVAKHFEGRTRRHDGDRASPSEFFAAEPERFSVIHFTAHAATNPTSPLDSAVILSGPAGGDKLYARDIAERSLRAELVTISACRSAGERAYAGEGLIGFSWAFLRAGARQVIAGLWDVDDQSTAMLMDTLYAAIARGDAAPDALRAAKLALMRQGGHVARPYYWGPFEVFTVSP